MTRALDPNNLRPFLEAVSMGTDVFQALREDTTFFATARRALFPLPFEREPALDENPFPALSPKTDASLQRMRFAVVASGGSGATSAVVGVQRAFEEAGITPVAVSAASGAVLFTALWACGMSSTEVAHFWMTLPRRAYVDPDWSALLRSTTRALGGWAGLLRGDAIERSLHRAVGDRRLGETRFPFSMPAWNVDLNRVEVFGTRETPDIPVATAMRVAISIPIFVEPVSVNDHFYGDGGIVNIFPVRPVLSFAVDRIIGLNSYLPENFIGEDVTGWRQRSFAILRASGQLRWSGMVALAREQATLAGDKLVLLHPVPYAEVRGAHFYEAFVDRSHWPQYMRAGLSATRDALERSARVPREAPSTRAQAAAI